MAPHLASTAPVKAGEQGRVAWPDVAKGVSILGVVLLHVCLAVPFGMDTFAAQVNHLLDPLRMPLFFLVSGVFSTKVLCMSLWELFSRRLWFFLVPYVLWTPIEVGLMDWHRASYYGSELADVHFYAETLLTAQNMYWFLYVLVAFNLVLWATRRLRPWVAVALSFTTVLALPLNTHCDTVGKFIMYLPIFMVGAHLSRTVRDFASSAMTPPKIVGATTAYVAGFAVYAMWYLVSADGPALMDWPLWPGTVVEANDVWTLVRTVGQFLMLPIAILAAVGLSKVPYLSPALQFLGRHTLPIYLGHPIALTIFFHVPLARLGGVEISLEAERWTHSTQFWVVACIFLGFAGGVMMWALQRIPVIGWTLKPPALAPVPGAVRAFFSREGREEHQPGRASREEDPIRTRPRR
ncbi:MULTISPECIES: acyltransferase family protein [unclassified Corynebacterium]|uniref:acyltransferase family protein n=1 Tax=unclassified Corynebacterium TaxID=2624378 RepID=UPI0029CA2D84|nr:MULTISPECIES: acyltransferase family protein [unclassified Corynebacterium]WPF65461.1 acyltransferase family protein [Corynebacterium sp. 22KM0430]WPF67957.1 acyltransferase family protein [Corynebacterium sp. 21KM1197]